MKKVFCNFILFLMITFILYIFIFNNKLITNSIQNSFNFFLNNIFFTIYPFMIFIDFILSSNYLNIFSNIKLKNISFFILCIFSSLPMNAHILKLYYNKGLIAKDDIINLLSFSSIPSIIYTIYYAGDKIFGSVHIGIILYISILISNILMYIYKYKKLNNIYINYKIDFNLKMSIINNLKNMIVVFGCISVFSLFINIIKHYLNINYNVLMLFNGILELSSGLSMFKLSNTSLILKVGYSAFILGFNGLSILFQQLSLLDIKNLNVKDIIKNKISVGLLASLISCLLLLLI